MDKYTDTLDTFRPEEDLDRAAGVLDTAASVIDAAIARITSSGGVDANQAVAYDLAHIASAVKIAQCAISYGRLGREEAALACAFTADALGDLLCRVVGREEEWGISTSFLFDAHPFTTKYRTPAYLAGIAEITGERHLDQEFDLARETFHRFAEDRIRPHAEQVHRHNDDIPEDIIGGLAELGGFGLSIPEEYGGFATGGESDYKAMVIATEELSWGALAIGGSLITRPEILARALVAGGSEEQKQRWLPKMAAGELMAAVAVTEPDYGSDVASITTTAQPVTGGWLVSGVKTWCTFAARSDLLMLLARTDPDRSKGHKGLSLFVIEKERADGKGFVLTQDAQGAQGNSANANTVRSDSMPGEAGEIAPESISVTGTGLPEGHRGRMEGRPIDTIGYRGLHSYELSFDKWFVPEYCLVGGEKGLGKGFYLQMQGFESGRLQTAARAIGVMQAAYEAACSYANDRVVFGSSIAQYQLTRVKLARMAVLIQSIRQFTYEVAGLMAQGEGSLEASMVKAYACKAAEWVTREAMQIHGGMGYAEEFPASRYFVDARVLSIFEGADETLSLKVIARRLIDQAG
ncbi:MAG: acyl-CoA dehydrogenase family protein [Acidimicrobiales bacterium]